MKKLILLSLLYCVSLSTNAKNKVDLYPLINCISQNISSIPPDSKDFALDLVRSCDEKLFGKVISDCMSNGKSLQYCTDWAFSKVDVLIDIYKKLNR